MNKKKKAKLCEECETITAKMKRIVFIPRYMTNFVGLRNLSYWASKPYGIPNYGGMPRYVLKPENRCLQSLIGKWRLINLYNTIVDISGKTPRMVLYKTVQTLLINFAYLGLSSVSLLQLKNAIECAITKGIIIINVGTVYVLFCRIIVFRLRIYLIKSGFKLHFPIANNFKGKRPYTIGFVKVFASHRKRSGFNAVNTYERVFCIYLFRVF